MKAVDVMARTGATYRQLDHWARTGVVVPIGKAGGSGTQREWSRHQVATIRAIVVLTKAGITLGAARDAAPALLQTGTAHLTPDLIVIAPQLQLDAA